MSDRAHKKKKASSSSSSSSSSYSGILPQTECCIAPSTLALAFSPHPPLVYHDTAHIQPTNQPATHASPPQTQRAWTKPLSLVAACTGLFQTVPPPRSRKRAERTGGGNEPRAAPFPRPQDARKSFSRSARVSVFPGTIADRAFSGSTVAL